MKHFFAASDGTYGYRRIHADLADEHTECSPELVRQIMRDGAAPAAARAQAARTLAEMVGALGRHAAPPASEAKPVAEMTREELEAELARSTLQRDPPATH